jgi:hypothetical protein
MTYLKCVTFPDSISMSWATESSEIATMYLLPTYLTMWTSELNYMAVSVSPRVSSSAPNVKLAWQT